MFRTCLHRRLQVACNHRGADCAYGTARIVVQTALSGGAASCSPQAIRSQPSAMRLQAHGLLDMLRVANAIDSSTVSTGSEQRRLDPTGRGQVDPLTVSICGPDPAFSRRPPLCGGDSAFPLSPRLLRRARDQRFLRLDLRIRESVHHRLAIQSDGAARCSSPAFTTSHWRRGFEPNDLHCILRAANATGSSTV